MSNAIQILKEMIEDATSSIDFAKESERAGVIAYLKVAKDRIEKELWTPVSTHPKEE